MLAEMTRQLFGIDERQVRALAQLRTHRVAGVTDEDCSVFVRPLQNNISVAGEEKRFHGVYLLQDWAGLRRNLQNARLKDI